jgi:hypothetical protein
LGDVVEIHSLSGIKIDRNNGCGIDVPWSVNDQRVDG